MTTGQDIETALRDVLDPEIGVNIVDLGLVYRIGLTDGSRRVEIDLGVTNPACPMGDYLRSAAAAAIRRRLPDVRSVEVTLTLEPPWHPGLMSDNARRQLGWEA